jgi:hypothetical protein
MLFAYESNPVSNEEALLIIALRKLFSTVQEAIDELPAGRYKAIASTNLETAAMFAIKAITHAESHKT